MDVFSNETELNHTPVFLPKDRIGLAFASFATNISAAPYELVLAATRSRKGADSSLQLQAQTLADEDDDEGSPSSQLSRDSHGFSLSRDQSKGRDNVLPELPAQAAQNTAVSSRITALKAKLEADRARKQAPKRCIAC